MRFLHLTFLVLALFSAGSCAFAQAPTDPLKNARFDCWVADDGPPDYTYFIRCITDRDVIPTTEPVSPFDLILNQLHHELHSGSSASVESTFKSNLTLINASAGVWNIPIYTSPPVWSWNEGMPEWLVKSVLCPDVGNACKAIFPLHLRARY